MVKHARCCWRRAVQTGTLFGTWFGGSAHYRCRVDRGAAASKWVESKLTKERCLINRFRMRKLLFFLRSEGPEPALPGRPNPLGTKTICQKRVRVEGIQRTLSGTGT